MNEFSDHVPAFKQQSDPPSAADMDRIEYLESLLGRETCQRMAIYRLPSDFVLSVVIPVYNEIETIEKVLQRLQATELPLEIIIVDDGSTDGAREYLSRLSADRVKVLFHPHNQGKGAALRTGFLQATGDVVVIQDADLEYDPQDFRRLLQPILDNQADVVYGSRYSGPERQVGPLWHWAANQCISRLFSFRHGLRFTDVETCYKLFRRELIQDIADQLREKRFGVELEMTARLLRRPGVRFVERPIRYDRRSYAEGKKIGWKDGLWALWCIARY